MLDEKETGSYNYENFIFEKIGYVLKITFNRPQSMNALSRKMQDDMHKALDEADMDPEVRCIVLCGAGRAFSVGYDNPRPKGEKANYDPTKYEYTGDYLAHYRDLNYKQTQYQLHFFRVKKPIIAAVHGYCLGLAMWIAVACDMTYCAEDAVFAQPEIRHSANTSFLIAAMCGWKHASRWLLTGDHMDGKEAERIGLVNECVPADKLMDKVMYIAERIAKVPPYSVKNTKAMIMSGFLAYGLSNALEVSNSINTIANCSHGPERQMMMDASDEKGYKGFLEARDGPFQPEPMGPRSVIKKIAGE